MKNRFKIIGILIMTAALLFGCTDKFEDFNIDKSKVVGDQLDADYYSLGGYFPQMQQMIYCNFNWGEGLNWPFQIMQNLNADIFSGYMMSPTPFAGNVNNTNYALVDAWNGANWNYTYSFFMTASGEAERSSKDEAPEVHAAVMILRVAAMHRLADQYGPIIYTKYGKSETGGEFDSQKDAYYAFFEDLSQAVSDLEAFLKENPGAKPLERYDLMFAGDFSQWIKYANSLRLRLAIRISKVEPEKAKTEGEAALSNSYGVLEETNATVSGKGYNHPLFTLSGQWHDIKMGGSIESIMSGYNDPRMDKYFLPVEDDTLKANGVRHKGIRQGIAIEAKETYVNHSTLNIDVTTPAQLMTAAEVYFLRAEAALYGWANAGGTPAALYQQGVEASFSQHGLAVGTYLESENTAAPFIDYLNEDNNVEAGSEDLNKVSPKWEEAADDEIKLQKIITQKYIAMFPQGMEAWAEYRRTGYPVLMPVVINNSQGKIDTKKQVRRLNFSSSEKNGNPEGYAKAVQLLGGDDDGGTPLWWDTRE